jgi:ABC-type amino acid transport substrate-binding protein
MRPVALAVLLTAALAPARAGRLDDIAARGVLRVGSTGDYKPFSYRQAGGEFIGMDVELAGELARALGVRLELVPTTWPTLMADLQADRFDLALSGVSVTAERQRQALFSVPYLHDGKTPITRCENIARYQALAQIDRPDVRLIVNPGGTNERFARTHAPHAQLTVYPDNVTIFG